MYVYMWVVCTCVCMCACVRLYTCGRSVHACVFVYSCVHVFLISLHWWCHIPVRKGLVLLVVLPVSMTPHPHNQ